LAFAALHSALEWNLLFEFIDSGSIHGLVRQNTAEGYEIPGNDGRRPEKVFSLAPQPAPQAEQSAMRPRAQRR
jgi:hypothetical protein